MIRDPFNHSLLADQGYKTPYKNELKVRPRGLSEPQDDIIKHTPGTPDKDDDQLSQQTQEARPEIRKCSTESLRIKKKSLISEKDESVMIPQLEDDRFTN